MKYENPPTRLRHPVLLVHGLGGFDQIRLELLKRYPVAFEYFKGVAATLRIAGAPRVYAVALPPSRGVEERSARLKEFAEREIHEERFHIIAHSMGGLDSRAYITHLGGDARVASLTTLGTPHRGSQLACLTADEIFGVGERLIARLSLNEIVRRLREETAAHRDLRPRDCERFNADTPDKKDVVYYSWAGEPSSNAMPWFLYLPHQILLRTENGGPNDGLVTTESARWTGWRGTIPVDHVGMVGWQFSRRVRMDFETLAFYASLVEDLQKAESRTE